jgi:hypothetical protein
VVLGNHVFGQEIFDTDYGFIFGDSRFGNWLQVRCAEDSVTPRSGKATLRG